MLRYNERPQIMARLILTKELLIMAISLASLALDVPSPIDKPTCALLNAGASFVPSPVTATTSPVDCNKVTNLALSSGFALEIILNFGSLTKSLASSSERLSNSSPVITYP